MLRFLLYSSFLLLTIQVFPNSQKVDSLIQVSNSLKLQHKSGEVFSVYSELIEEYKKQNDTLNIVSISIEMAEMSRSAGSHHIALILLNELEESQLVITPKQEIHILLIKGSTYYEISERDSAINLSVQALAIAQQLDFDEYNGLLYNLIGASYLQSDHDSAIAYFEKSIIHFTSKDDVGGAVLPYINISRLYRDNEQYQKGIETLFKSLAILDEEDIPIYRKMIYANLAIIYKDLLDFEKSTLYLNLRDSLNFRINNNTMQFQVSQFQSRLEEEKTARELMTLEVKVEMAQLENQKNQVILILGLLIILIMGLGLFFSIKISRHRKEIAQVLANKTKDLESINKFKNQVLSVISHDMRSPLAQVITFQHAKNSGINFSPDEMVEMDKTIMASAKNGLLILDNLLKWANNQFSGEKLITENFDSRFVLTQILNQVSELAKEKDIVLHSNIAHQEIHTNESLFQIIIRNLLSNAIKFSPLHSEVRISTKLTQGFLEVAIIDQGPGVPEKVLVSLKKGENNKPKIGSFGEKGAGIGLSFSKEFAERIGGSFAFSKDIMVGTEVIFRVPIGKID